ncbi:MAG: TonB-dependent receptor [Deltaproteobacteria bacterium]|nr:TonB-dependent receptor [Deltaproteobacteria bacterium]
MIYFSVILIFIFAFLPQLLFSQEIHKLETIIISAEKVTVPASLTQGSVNVITSEEIELRHLDYAKDALGTLPGLNLTRSGGKGALTGLFIRGMNSEHTLVLLDGMELNDPTSSNRSFDFGHFLLENVERIEILKGAQSLSYGSDAIAGVVNIVTKTGKGKPTFSLTSSAASHSTFRESGSLSGGTEKINYFLSFTREDSKGISSADKRFGNDEKDSYRNSTLFSKIQVKPNENIGIHFLLNHINSYKELDYGAGPKGDDPNYDSRLKNLVLKGSLDIKLFDGKWTQKLSYGVNDMYRNYENDPDPVRTFWSRYSYEGAIEKIEWQNNMVIRSDNEIVFGIEYERENAKYESLSSWGKDIMPKKSTHTISLYVQDRFDIKDRVQGIIGIRTDDHSRFGTETTFRIAPSLSISETRTRLKGSYSTGFKAPTVYQLFAPADPFMGPVGNKDLKPEKTKSYEIGLEQMFFKDRMSLGVTYFENYVKDLIIFDYDPVLWVYYGFKNVGKAETKGFEFTLSGTLTESLNFTLGYTLCHARDKEADEPLPRRPKHKFDAAFQYRVLDRASFGLECQYIGERYNNTGRGRKMGGYTVFGGSVDYRINKNLLVFGRVENMFDKHYYEVWGYGTEGRVLKGGIKLTF